MIATARTPASVCRTCGQILDAATEAHARAVEPKKGDLSLCFGCGELARFDAELGLVPTSLNALGAEVTASQRRQIERLQRGIRARRPN